MLIVLLLLAARSVYPDFGVAVSHAVGSTQSQARISSLVYDVVGSATSAGPVFPLPVAVCFRPSKLDASTPPRSRRAVPMPKLVPPLLKVTIGCVPTLPAFA